MCPASIRPAAKHRHARPTKLAQAKLPTLALKNAGPGACHNPLSCLVMSSEMTRENGGPDG
jgi:hypothetical protein